MARGRAVLLRAWPAAMLVLFTVGAMTATYRATHQIFPDTQYYLGWTYRLMGYSKPESSRLVHEYIAEHGVFPAYKDIWSWFTGTMVTRPRQLLPVLSVPFVWAFGPGAIVVVPGLAFLAAVYLMYRLAAGVAGPVPALLASLPALLTMLVLAWSVGGLTDSLALLLHVVMLVLLPWRAALRWPFAAGIVVACALTGAARFIAPFTLATIGLLWLWAMWRCAGRRWSWTVAAFCACMGEAAAMAWTRWASGSLRPTQQIMLSIGSRRAPGQHLRDWYLHNLDDIIRDELRIVLSDPALYTLLVLALAGCIVCWRSAAPALVLAAAIGSLGIMIANPVATHFRYEIPTLPALIYAAALFLHWAHQRARANRPSTLH